MSDTNQRIADIVGGKDVVLFMKGTPLFPQCGFSSRAVAILDHCGVAYDSVAASSAGRRRRARSRDAADRSNASDSRALGACRLAYCIRCAVWAALAMECAKR